LSSRGEARRRRILASALAAVGALLLGVLWIGNRRGQPPADAEGLFVRGGPLLRQGRLAEAIAAFRAAIQIKPDLAVAHTKLGVALHQQGNVDEAITEYRTAIRLDPDAVEAHNNLGNALGAQGKHEASAEFRAAIRLNPDDAQAHYNLGVALRYQGNLEEASAEFRSAIRLNPVDAGAHNGLAWALVVSPNRPRRDYEEGLRHARRAVELVPNDGSVANTLALAEYRSSHRSESIAAAERSAALRSGGNAHDWFVLAMAHWQKGDKDEARKWFDKAVAWTREDASENSDWHRFWEESAELPGQPGPGV
jgi:tetratricopeptide (TPR) repeat protein